MHKLKIKINKRNNKDAIQSHNGQQQDTSFTYQLRLTIEIKLQIM